MTANGGAKQAPGTPLSEDFVAVSNRFHNNGRLLQLSVPKSSKATYWTSFGPTLQWGNQDTMWPISKSALEAIASPRLKVLAEPKGHQTGTDIPEFVYGCGRASGIWSVPPRALTARPSQRVIGLAQHKTAPASYIEHREEFQYSCGRCSPIWRPTRSSMLYQCRPHIVQLATPRQPQPAYMPSRQVETVVSPSAKTCVASERVAQLALAKNHVEGPFRDPQWVVNPGTLQAVPSERVTQLGQPRKYTEGYQPSREVIWRVSSGALNAVPSTRMCDLSKPIVRETMDSVQFNPDAFTVSEKARKAKASPRIEELAQPIKRGT